MAIFNSYVKLPEGNLGDKHQEMDKKKAMASPPSSAFAGIA
jgi:hypothetical protein